MIPAPSGFPRSGTVLHVGCGNERMGAGPFSDMAETRLDIDPNCKPDIVASMTDMGEIGPFDMVYSSHCLEHLESLDALQALREAYRVLKPGGFLLLFVPDTEGVEPTEEVLFESPAGPIAGLDLLFGLRRVLHLMPYMAHKTAYVRETLENAITAAGFAATYVKRIGDYNLIGGGRK